MKKIGIIGMGKWGKNLIREFSNFAEISICVTNGNQENINWIQKNYPKTKISTNVNDILNENNIDAIVIATPIITHYELIKKSLESGKHVFVEKPMVQTIGQATLASANITGGDAGTVLTNTGIASATAATNYWSSK